MRFTTAEERSPSEASRQRPREQSPHSAGDGSPRPATASTVRFGENRIARLSPNSDDTVRHIPSSREYAGRAPTPGLDDSPYVRFAIDQLTRDEHIRTPRRTDSVFTNNDDYPVDRLVWDEIGRAHV